MTETTVAGLRVLITGGLGFIGSNLAHRCLELGAQVAVYDNLNPHGGGSVYNVKGIEDRIEVIGDDLLDFDALVKQVAGRDIVFNCAASTSHPRSMREPWFDLDVNSRGVVNLLEALRRVNPSARLVHVGTSTQTGPLHYQPADEQHPEFPTDIYSANKSASEKYVLIYARAYGLPATVIRLANVFGPRATIKSAEFTFNNYFVGLALQDKDITIWGDGAQLRNVIYVNDAVTALILAATSPASHGQTFFATGDRHLSVAEIATMTVRCIGAGRVVHVPWPADRKVVEIGDAVFANAKIKKTLGWTPVHDIEVGLRLTRDYYLSCLQEYPLTKVDDIWQGVFQTWGDACAASSPAETSFSSERWLARVTGQLVGYREERATHGTGLPPRPSNLPWVCGAFRPRRIVDFGGSSGWCWDYVRDSVSGQTVESYVIVENAAVVSYMQASGLHAPPVVYVSDPSALDACDLVYCNSVLQYFGTNEPLVDIARRTHPRHILLDDLLASGDDDFYSTQLYYGAAIPHRFVGLGGLAKDLFALGYRAVVRVPHTSPILGVTGPLPMFNLPEEFRVRYATSVLYERIGEPS